MSCDFFSISGCFAVGVGYDWSIDLQYIDDSTDPETPIDLTGYTLVMHIQEQGSDVDILTLSEVGDNLTTGLYIPDPTTGIFYPQIMEAETTSVGEGTRDYFIDIIDPDGLKTPFLSGDQVFEKIG